MASGPPLDLPSAGPEPIPFDVALAAVLGYVRGRRPLRFRSPSVPQGRWLQVAAFGYVRFDGRPRATGPLGEDDLLAAECLHGRLSRDGWTAVRGALDDVRDLADAATERAAGRAFWELPTEEFSVLGEPGTVGAALRSLSRLGSVRDSSYVAAALHHRRPELFPLLDGTTLRQFWPHVEEGDSGVAAVVHRELVANADGFAALEAALRSLLGTPGPGRLRWHDVLVWLSGSLRLTHAVALGRSTAEWTGRD
ncbi:DUF6308 family protein [Geodermatophilus sabuli]|uniref:Uncharacterized protein n=1 Tax=Geodermatophilus sabuli TaxID=1564158 RepID=A0A285EI77_9ACTN|nr:DUF6308 family protein [Geodermatophilus sabuli]MBB3086612.1 hypothetical protein [Geodermatophilus sabuli]SNX97736.1 hypothetical protein SAMN06893097_108101 [Geodermatophilus sabuli]